MSADAGLPTRLTGRTVAVLVLCALFMLIEGVDLAAMPLAVPRVSMAWNQPASSFAISLSAVLIGIGIAAVAIAPLGERIGRSRMILLSGIVTAVVTAATATSQSVEAFALWRFLTGLGLGTCLPNITATVAVIAPAPMRARVLVLVNTSIPVGSVAAGVIMAPLAQAGGWQAIFLLAAGLTLIPTLGLAVLIPRAERSQPTPAATVRARSPIFDLFEPQHRAKTFALLALATTNTFLMYMMINWLPTLLPRGGISVDEAARLSSLFQFGGIVGGFAFAFLMDRGLSIPAFLGGYVLSALALIGVAFMAGPLWLLLLVIGLGISGAQVAIIIFGMSFYRAGLLSSFVGVSLAVTRAGAVSGPLVGGWLIAHTLGVRDFMLAAVLPVLLCLAWVLLIGRLMRARDASA